MRPGPLSGIRVLDLSRLLPGPVCTLHLADLGAEVIKVEDLAEGDYARSLGAKPGEMSAYFRAINRHKKSIALDLKTAPGVDVFLRLARGAEIIVESFRPGIVAKLGVGYEAVRALNPAAVYCSISGYGQTGPNRDRAGHDINYLALAGVLDQMGVAGGPPALSNLQIADLLGGALTASMSILAALFDAQRSGEGRYIDVAMADASFAHQYFALHALATWGRPIERGRDLLTGGVPCYQVYATRDGRHLAVGALEPKFWRALCAALERPDLIARQFDSGEAGEKTRRELQEIFAQRTQAEWTALLASVDCCVSPVLSLDEAMRDEQFVSRGMVLGRTPAEAQFAYPARLSDFVGDVSLTAPRQGEHGEEVLLAAGYTAKEIAELRGSRVLALPEDL